MGCFFSSETEQCCICDGKAVDNLVIRYGVCEDCRNRRSSSNRQNSLAAAALPERCYGEYRCACGRFWSSRLSRRGCWQICIRCRRQVYAHTQRELRPSDMAGVNENVEEHKRELCQMCIQLGRYCGPIRKEPKAVSKCHKKPQRTSKYY